MMYPIKKFFYNVYWKFIHCLWVLKIHKRPSSTVEDLFSIGIVTYVDRFENFFKPLLRHLAICFPATEIVVVVNGYYNLEKQRIYLQQIKSFLNEFEQIKIIDFEMPQSLSKLWNLAVINSAKDKVLIMNDDLRIAPWFHRELRKSEILGQEIGLINRSWSHFLISKGMLRKIGYFDERFPGVGNEDEDYECRLVLNGISIKSFAVKSLKNIVFKTKNFSYGKETPIVNGKYVKANKVFFDSKWDSSISPLDGYVYVEILKAYVKLKEGMETPNFYPN